MVITRVFMHENCAERDLEVEVAPGLTFEEMVWLMETTYKEVIGRLVLCSERWRFTLFSPSGYRVTCRKANGSFYEYAYHGWWETRDAEVSAVEYGILKGFLCSCVVGDSKSPLDCAPWNNHWGSKNNPLCQACLKNPCCMVCLEEFRSRKCIETRDSPPISLKPRDENEVEVTSGLTFDQMARLPAYERAVKKQLDITVFSPPHNRVRKTFFGRQSVTDCEVHPCWMKGEAEETSAATDNLLDMVRCPTCAADFKDPVVLGCGHIIKRAAVNNYWGRSDPLFPCPGCIEKTPTKLLELHLNGSMDLIVNI